MGPVWSNVVKEMWELSNDTFDMHPTEIFNHALLTYAEELPEGHQFSNTSFRLPVIISPTAFGLDDPPKD